MITKEVKYEPANEDYNSLELHNTNLESFTMDLQEKSEIQSKISGMLQRSDGIFSCNVCGKSGKDLSNMKRHTETHIDGISYPCTVCDKTFKSKNSFRVHNYSLHKTK